MELQFSLRFLANGLPRIFAHQSPGASAVWSALDEILLPEDSRPLLWLCHLLSATVTEAWNSAPSP